MLYKIVFASLITIPPLLSQEIPPKHHIRYIDQIAIVNSGKVTAKQIILTSGGKKRTLEMKSYTKNKNEKQLIIYTAPRRVKGDKILMLNEGDDIWFYTPKTDRVRHLASHAKRQKVQGSDFSYEDMAGGSIEEDYTYKLLGEEKVSDSKCFKFQLIPTETGPHYSKLILWGDKTKFITRRIDYYEEGELIKRFTSENIQKIDNRWYAKKITMTNIKEGGETVIETVTIKFDINIDDKIFTTNNLKRR